MGVFADPTVPCFGTTEPFLLKTIMTNPDSLPNVDIASKYALIKLLSGGKSGAYIFLIKNIDTSTNQEFILKFYPNSLKGSVREGECDYTGKKKPIFDERPFRETLALCSLQGKPGFSKLYEYGIMATPTDWVPSLATPRVAKRGLFVVMSKMEGKPLTEVNFAFRKPEFGAIIAWKLLSILDTLSKTLGPSAEHFDFHPDNIFINYNETNPRACQTIEWISSTGSRVRIGCPEVNIIDFDLIDGEMFHSGNRKNLFENELPEQHAKKVGFLPVPERTLQFCIQMIGLESTIIFFAYLKRIENTDIRNWWIIASCLMIRTAGLQSGIQLCRDIVDCLKTNKVLFSIVRPSATLRANRYFPTAKEISATELAVAKQAVTLLDSFVVTVWQPYDTYTYNIKIPTRSGRQIARQEHPNFDTTAILFDIYSMLQNFPHDVYASLAVNINNLFYLKFPYRTNIKILTNQIANLRILLDFEQMNPTGWGDMTRENIIKSQNKGNSTLGQESQMGLRGKFGNIAVLLGTIAKHSSNLLDAFLSNISILNQNETNAIFGTPANLYENLPSPRNSTEVFDFIIRYVDIKIKNPGPSIQMDLYLGEVKDINIFFKILVKLKELGKVAPNIEIIETNKDGQPTEKPGLFQRTLRTVGLGSSTNYYKISIPLPIEPNNCAKAKKMFCELPETTIDYQKNYTKFELKRTCVHDNNIVNRLFIAGLGLVNSAIDKGLTQEYDVFLQYLQSTKVFNEGMPYKAGERTAIQVSNELQGDRINRVNVTNAYKAEIQKLKENLKLLRQWVKATYYSKKVASVLSDQYILYKIPPFLIHAYLKSQFHDLQDIANIGSNLGLF
jgi:hypothetical protein